MVLQSSPGRLGSPPGAHLGDLGSLLGRSWALLGRSWVAFGGPGSEFVRGLFCSMMLLSAKSRIGTIWERFGDDLEAIFGGILVSFGACGDRLAQELRATCELLASELRATCDRLASDLRTTCKVDELTTAIDITMHCWSIRGPPSTHGRF